MNFGTKLGRRLILRKCETRVDIPHMCSLASEMLSLIILFVQKLTSVDTVERLPDKVS